MKKRIFAAVLALSFVLSAAAEAKTVRFSDVAQSHWAYEAIMTCAEKGAVEGTQAADKNGVGKFEPEGTVTLGQMLAVLTRLVAVTDTPKASAQDKNWASPYYRAAIEGDIIRASDFSEEALSETLTREDMAYLLVRAARVGGEVLENDLDSKIYAKADIADFIEVEQKRQDYVLQAYINGLLTGYDNGNFGPKDSVTRAQMAVIVCRLMEYQPRIEVNYCDLPKFNDGSSGG
ncbi:MAG: S-layer homology domain-containing protein [Oscillospiraceae bacterium]|nr:S-layer homology domain-containing protein [Oscillospiraceae bacterium]